MEKKINNIEIINYKEITLLQTEQDIIRHPGGVTEQGAIRYFYNKVEVDYFHYDFGTRKLTVIFQEK